MVIWFILRGTKWPILSFRYELVGFPCSVLLRCFKCIMYQTFLLTFFFKSCSPRPPTRLVWLNKVKRYQKHIPFSDNGGKSPDNEMLQWEHSGFQTTSDCSSAACGPAHLYIFKIVVICKSGQKPLDHINATTSRCLHFFVCFSIDRGRQRQTEGGRKQAWKADG